MTTYPLSAYGPTNPNAGHPANGDDEAWGGHAWPDGVPDHLLGRCLYESTFGEHLELVVRVELVDLWTVALTIADVIHGYRVFAQRDGVPWRAVGLREPASAGEQLPIRAFAGAQRRPQRSLESLLPYVHLRHTVTLGD